MEQCDLCGGELKCSVDHDSQDKNIILGMFCENKECENNLDQVLESLRKQIMSNGFFGRFEGQNKNG